MEKPFRITVLASTKGTDLQAIIDEIKAGKMPGIELALVLSNKKNAYALERARTQGFKAVFVDPKGQATPTTAGEPSRQTVDDWQPRQPLGPAALPGHAVRCAAAGLQQDTLGPGPRDGWPESAPRRA